MVRRTFSSPSRVDHASRVMWVPPTDLPVAADVSAANWRQHFSSVGGLSQCFDDEFFEEVSQRFHVINSQPVVLGLFDGLFTPSELRRALTLCFDSAVGIDGLPHSVFKTNLLWWQSAVLHFFTVLSWGVVSTRGSAALWFPCSSVGTSLPTLSPHFSRQLLLQNLRAPGPCENWPRGFPLGCGLSGWVFRRPFHITVLLAHFCGFHRHSQSF